MNIHGCQLHPKVAIYVVKQLKNDSFKTRDFSPLIERVLAGVTYYFCKYSIDYNVS